MDSTSRPETDSSMGAGGGGNEFPFAIGSDSFQTSIRNETRRIQLAPGRIQLISSTILSRKAVLAQRSNVEVRWRQFDASRKSFKLTRSQLVSIGTQIIDLLNDTPCLSKELQDQFRDKLNELNTKSATLDQEDQSLAAELLKLSKMETALVHQDKTLLGHEKLMLRGSVATSRSGNEISGSEGDGTSTEEGDVGTISHDSQSSTQLHPLAREYYNEIGNLILAHDQIHNFDTSRLTELLRGKPLADPGIRSTNNEEQFIQDYLQERKELVSQYMSIKSSIFDLYERCKHDGLDIEKPNLPPKDPSLSENMLYSTQDGTMRALPNTSITDIIRSIKTGSNIFDPVQYAKPSVTAWVKDVLREESNSRASSETVLNKRGKDRTARKQRREEPWLGTTGSSSGSPSRPRRHLPDVSPSRLSSPGSDDAEFTKFQPEIPTRRYSNPDMQSGGLSDVEDKLRGRTLQRAHSISDYWT